MPVRIFPELRRDIDPFRDLAALWSLSRALRRESPDWVHTHSSKAGIVGRAAARRAGVARIAHTVHGWGFTAATPAWRRDLFVRLERRAARGAALVFVNPLDLAEGRRLGIVVDGQGSVVPPGIDLAPYRDEAALAARRREVRRRFDLGADEPVAGFLGRLAPQKSPQTVLAVASHLARARPDLRWLVAGDGPLAPELRAAAARDPVLRERIAWAGLVDDAADVLPAFDLLLVPSLWEGAPLGVMEAMAAGVPIVASDLPGVTWLMQGTPDSATPPAAPIGRVCPPGAVDAFAAAILELLDDVSLRASLAQAGRRVALERFGLDTMLERLLALYAGKVAGKR